MGISPIHSPLFFAVIIKGPELFPAESPVPNREQGFADSHEGFGRPFDDASKGLPTLSLWPPSSKYQKNFSFENFWAGHIMGGVLLGFSSDKNGIEESVIFLGSGPIRGDLFSRTEILKKFPDGAY